MQQVDVAKLLGITKARLNTYCHDSRKGKRRKPNGEILYLACTKLFGFYLDFGGQRISASTFTGDGTKQREKFAKQLTFKFDRQFNLTGDAGAVTVKVKRPPGRIEFAVSLKAEAP
jgi:hypothetical protein